MAGFDGLVAGFGLIAALLLASALWLPPFLALLLKMLAHLARRRPLTHWALADMQLQLPRLSLAMMALLIALATNLGVGSMVGGFRLTFLDWLDQRLVAPLYLNVPSEQYADIDAWLAEHPEVFERLLTRRSDATLQTATTQEGSRSLGAPIELYGITPGDSLRTGRYWQPNKIAPLPGQPLKMVQFLLTNNLPTQRTSPPATG